MSMGSSHQSGGLQTHFKQSPPQHLHQPPLSTCLKNLPKQRGTVQVIDKECHLCKCSQKTNSPDCPASQPHCHLEKHSTLFASPVFIWRVTGVKGILVKQLFSGLFHQQACMSYRSISFQRSHLRQHHLFCPKGTKYRYELWVFCTQLILPLIQTKFIVPYLSACCMLGAQ